MAELRVNIGWAGGWDEYDIDPNITRLETPEEIAADEARIAKGWGGDPVIGFREWLRVAYIGPGSTLPQGRNTLREDHPQYTLFKIIRHVRGGD